jgi:hypothetical protein
VATETTPDLVGGRYRIERLLGRGGMGAVYQVLDEGTGRALALKRMQGPARFVGLFEREFRTLAALRHPRIVRVLEYGVDPAGAYYTMELLQGEDLSKRAPMPWREVCACLRDVASVLGLLHSRRLVHRDLNPRNLWQTPEGRLKLLDFGALSPFGVASELVGTPAFVAPEALDGRPLDPRTDLFALGALGYWLLTSVHAYRASQLSELARAWTKAPASPSSLAKRFASADALPPELDRLLESLLRLDPDERPSNTAEVIDRLHAIAGLTPEPEQQVVQGYLDSRAFVGRTREKDRFTVCLATAAEGTPQALCIAGPEGVGRTRLLEELALLARMQGATAVSVTGANGFPYETALALQRELGKALPREAKGPHPSSVGSVRRDALDERALRQQALASWIGALARERTVVLLVDDLHVADDESQALLATLARSAQRLRLLIVSSVDSDVPSTPTVRGFVTGAQTLQLVPLREEDVREMLRSVFGEVPYLERLAARLHRLADGNPSHAWLLVQQLVRRGLAHYADGAWTLPTDLPSDLPATLAGTLEAGLEGLSPEQLQIARWVSLPDHGALPRALLGALGALDDAAIDAAIVQGVLREAEDGLRLAHPALRDVLRAALAPEDRLRAHRILAARLAERSDLIAQVQSALHALHCGAHASADARLLAASMRILRGEHEALRVVAPMFVDALALLRASGREDRALPALCVLAVAGYQVDRLYADQFGDDALEALQRALHFGLARRLRRYLGGFLALLTALAVAALRRRNKVSPIELVGWLVTVLGYLMGPAAMCIDQRRLHAYARVFEPLLALGRDHAVAHVHRFCLGLALSIEDRCAEAQLVLKRVIDRLHDPRPIRALPAANRRNLLSAALYAYGLRQTFACDPGALDTARELDGGSVLHGLQGDQLRGIYHAMQGDAQRAEAYERKVETKAIQLGTAWQAELLTPRSLWRRALWAQDPSAHKQALDGLLRLARDIPSLARSARWAKGAECVLHGKHAQAIALLDHDDEPLTELGWVLSRALLARALNAQGEHERARAVCLDALSRLGPDDRAFVMMNLPVELELALAECALGEDADARLARLLAEHADKGPLVLGTLWSVRMRAALKRGELEAAARYLEATELCFRPTRAPSLLMQCAELRHDLTRARGEEGAPDAPLAADDAHLLTRVELRLDEERAAAAALQASMELSGADRGLYLPCEGAPVQTGERVCDDAIAWAMRTLMEQLEERTEAESDLPPADATTRVFDGIHYTVAALRFEDQALGVLVLGAAGQFPAALPSGVLPVMAARLARNDQS